MDRLVSAQCELVTEHDLLVAQTEPQLKLFAIVKSLELMKLSGMGIYRHGLFWPH